MKNTTFFIMNIQNKKSKSIITEFEPVSASLMAFCVCAYVHFAFSYFSIGTYKAEWLIFCSKNQHCMHYILRTILYSFFPLSTELET